MNLLYDNIIFSLQQSGGISVVWKENLERFLRSKDIHLKCIEYPNNNYFRNKIKIPSERLIVLKPRVSISCERYLQPKIKVENETIFHSSYYRVCLDPKLKNVTTVHDFTYEYFKKGIRKNIHLNQKYKAIEKSEAIICISNNTKKDLLKFCPNISEEKVYVIYNGVSEKYKPINKKVTFIPFEKNEYILYVGDRKNEYKNFNMAVEASSMSKIPLVIVGNNLSIKEKKYLDSLVYCNYYLANSVSENDLNLLYNNALCLLYPSSYEGFGIPLIEAQKAGCPVIASNNSSVKEIVKESGLLINDIDSNKISDSLKLLGNYNDRNELILKGYKNAEKFSWDRCNSETKKVYKDLINK